MIRRSRRLVSGRLIKRHCNPDILWCIQPRLSFEVRYHCFNTVSSVKYIIHYQQFIFVSNLLNEVTHVKDLDLIVTAPTVQYQVVQNDGSTVFIDSPAKLPDPDGRQSVSEPYVQLEMFCPKEYSGTLMELAQN